MSCKSSVGWSCFLLFGCGLYEVRKPCKLLHCRFCSTAHDRFYTLLVLVICIVPDSNRPPDWAADVTHPARSLESHCLFSTKVTNVPLGGTCLVLLPMSWQTYIVKGLLWFGSFFPFFVIMLIMNEALNCFSNVLSVPYFAVLYWHVFSYYTELNVSSVVRSGYLAF